MEQEKYSNSTLNNSSSAFNTIFKNADHEISTEYQTDSAYSSGYNLSSCETPNTSRYNSHQSDISTPRCLNVIHENSTDSVKLTPVTQNICRIFNFHITTPKSIDFNKQQSQGVKRSSQLNLQSTPKKIKLTDENNQENETKTPLRTPSKSIKTKQPLSESKQNIFNRLHSAPDLKNNTQFDKFNIQKYSNTNSNNSSNAIENLVTKPNSINKLLKCSNDEFEAILKTDLTPKKTDSFSFQDHRTSYSIKSLYSFEKIHTKTDGKNSFCRTLSFSTSPKKNEKKIGLVKLNRTKKSLFDFKNEQNVSKENSDMEISPSNVSNVIKRRIALNVSKGNSDMELSPFIAMKTKKKCENIPVTPMKRKISVDDNSLEKSSYPKTPKKMKYQYSSKHINSKKLNNFSAESETKSVITNFRTPTKLHSKRHQNLQLHQLKAKERFTNRPCNLNIIEKLSNYPVLIDTIFSHLSSYDLLNLMRVSKSFSNIINNIRRTKARIDDFITEYKSSKENFNEKDFDKAKNKKIDNFQIENLKCDKKLDKKLPFSNINFEIKKDVILIEEPQPTKIKGFISPNVSPSKRKFYENQKIVNTLSATQHCVKCPRCAKPSRAIITENDANSAVVTQTSSFPVINHHSRFNKNGEIICNRNSISIMDSNQFQPILKTKLIKTMSVDSGLYMKRSVRRNSSPTTNFQPYGECSALSCYFKFCLKCNCEYHPGKLCILELDTGSPIKDELNETSYVKSKKSFKRQKSLKRLCF